MKFENLLSDRGKDYFYIMHLSYNGSKRRELWNYAKENNIIGLDASRIVRDDWTKVRHSAKRLLPDIWVRQFDTFCSEMRRGDIVLALKGWDSLLGVAEITQRHHIYNRQLSATEKFFDHIRQVKWIRKYEYDYRQILSKPLEGFNNTLSIVTRSSPRWSILTNLTI